jgi:hypothetical protein
VERILVPEIMKMGETLVMKTYVTNNGKSHSMPFKITTKIGDWISSRDIDWVLDPGTTLEIPDKISGFPEGDFKIERILSFPHWWDKTVTYTKDPEPNSASVMLYVRDALIADVQADRFNVLTEPLVAGEEMEFELVSSGRDFPPMPASPQDPIQNRIMYVPEGKFRNRADWVTLYQYDIPQSALLEKTHYEKALVPPDVFSFPSGMHLLAYVVDWTMVVGTDINQDNDYIFRELEFKPPVNDVGIKSFALSNVPDNDSLPAQESSVIYKDRDLRVELSLSVSFADRHRLSSYGLVNVWLTQNQTNSPPLPSTEKSILVTQVPIKALFDINELKIYATISNTQIQNWRPGKENVTAYLNFKNFTDENQANDSKTHSYNFLEEELYIKWLAGESENIRLCENGENLEKGGFITIPPPSPTSTGRVLMLEILECNFIVGRVKKGTFTPVKKPTRVLIKENVEELYHPHPEPENEEITAAIPRAYYTGGDPEFRIAELQTDEQGKLNNVKLASTAHYGRNSDLWEHFLKNEYIDPEPGRIYFDGFKLFPTVHDEGKEVNYLTVPQWILEHSREFTPIKKPNPRWFNESLRYYLKGIATSQRENDNRYLDDYDYLSITFRYAYLLSTDPPSVSYSIRPRPTFDSSGNPTFGKHVNVEGKEKTIDLNVFRHKVRFDESHEESFLGEEFEYKNMFYATLLHEARHAFQACMHGRTATIEGNIIQADGDGDHLLNPHFIKHHWWSIEKYRFGYLIDDNHPEFPDYRNKLIGNSNFSGFRGFSGDTKSDTTEATNAWRAARELDARYFSYRHNSMPFRR